MPIGTQQPPQPTDETAASSLVEHVEASHVGWNLAKIVKLGVLPARLSIEGLDHPLVRQRVALALVRLANEQLQIGEAVSSILEGRNVLLGDASQAQSFGGESTFWKHVVDVELVAPHIHERV